MRLNFKNAILDDLRIILNFNMDSKDYAILLLVGQTAFINQLQRQNHDALRQRIVVNYYLNGLSKEEVKEYIISRLALQVAMNHFLQKKLLSCYFLVQMVF